MTPPFSDPTPERRTVRELLIDQQSAAHSELPLPRLLRTPSVVILWALALSTVVAALALGRVRVPRVARGTVVTRAAGFDSLTPVLLLPATAREFVAEGQLATVDTGGVTPLVVAIASGPPRPPTDRVTPHVRTPLGGTMSADTASVAVPLDRCRDRQCLPLSANRRFTATARLGTRSLASFALPGS